MAFNNSIRLFFEPNAEDQSAFNEQLKETRNLSSEIKNNFTSINNETKGTIEGTKQINQNINEVLNKLQKSRNILSELRKDFTGLDKEIKKIGNSFSTSFNDKIKLADDNLSKSLDKSKTQINQISESLKNQPQLSIEDTKSSIEVKVNNLDELKNSISEIGNNIKDLGKTISDSIVKAFSSAQTQLGNFNTQLGQLPSNIPLGVDFDNSSLAPVRKTLEEDTDFLRKQFEDKIPSSLEGTISTVGRLRNSFRGIGIEIDTELTEKIKKAGEKGNIGFKKLIQSINKDLVSGFGRAKIEVDEIVKITQKQINGSLTVAKVTEVIDKLKARQRSIEENIIEAQSEGIITEERALELRAKSNAQFAEALAMLKKSKEVAESIDKRLGITYKIFEGINKVPILNSLVNVKKVTEAMEETASKGTNAFKVFGTGVKSTFAQVLKSARDPLILLTAQIVILKKFFDVYGGINQRVTEQGRQLGLNYKQSGELYNSALDYAASQNNAFITGQRILEGRAKLNEALGTSVNFTNEEAATAERLSHYYGINAEQNGKLAQLSIAIGSNNKKVLDTVLKTSVTQKSQYGGTIAYQKVVQQVSNVSGEILTKFKGNVTELTKAVMQADRLGLTLEQVDKIGESLLNFEQSIESELKAELLTGKAINLEKARSAALSGDTSKLMNEIVTQVGNIHQFEKMNVIQRKAYAEAFGMSASEMGDMLRKQEFEAKLAGSGAKSAQEKLDFARKNNIEIAESIEKELEAKSLAELQKATFEKIGEILARITSGPMESLFKKLEKGLKFVGGIMGYFNKMTGGALGSALAGAIIGIPAILGVVGVASTLVRLLSGRMLKDALLPKPSGRFGDQIHVIVDGGMGMGMGGGMMRRGVGMPMIPGQGPRSFTPQTMPKGPLTMMPMGGGVNPATPTAAGKLFRMPSMGAAMGYGTAALGVGMLTSAVTANMEEGKGKTAVSVGGGIASGALAGAMFGPIGAGIGAAAGALWGLYNSHKESEERRKQEDAQRIESEKRTQEMLENLSVRPIELNVSNDTIGKWNTYSSQNGANPSFA